MVAYDPKDDDLMMGIVDEPWNEEDFGDAIKRLIDAAIGEIDGETMIEILEGRIGVIRARMEEENEE